jgi:hypothetical protein
VAGGEKASVEIGAKNKKETAEIFSILPSLHHHVFLQRVFAA